MAPAKVRRAPYKDFLQPALHRRFSTTATILLAIAYVEAFLLGDKSSLFWSWFPIGSTGIRTLFIFSCGLAIIVLRIAQYHVGYRTSNSAFETFTKHAAKIQTAEAIFSYVFASWLFSQVYLWSASENLRWIIVLSGDRARLNERPLFVTCHFLVIGFYQAVVHLFKDNDRLLLGVAKRQAGGGNANEQKEAEGLFARFGAAIPAISITAGTDALASLFLSVLVVYPFFMRTIAWRTALSIFGVYYNLPKSRMLPAGLPFPLEVLTRCLVTGFLLCFMLAAGNSAFSLFLVKEPLKNGQPLTSETKDPNGKSKDPNGSLLNGLKSKKQPIRCFAMWELAFIARDFEDRRKMIFEDIDRKDGSTWSQIFTICINTVKSVQLRIEMDGKPEPPAVPELTKTEERKRLSQPPREGDVFKASTGSRSLFDNMEKVVGQMATSPRQRSRLSPVARRAMNDAKERLQTVQRDVTAQDESETVLQSLVQGFLGSVFGWPFRQEFRRRIAAVVLGGPYGEPSEYVNAINALSQLAVKSLTEDKYGNVQRDVSVIIKTFTSLKTKLEVFRADTPMHWTDVSKQRGSPEVEAILEALQDALTQLLEAFEPYTRDIRLSLTDLRLARDAAHIGRRDEERDPEMVQVR